jgi:DNA-binding NtrC family response regulator
MLTISIGDTRWGIFPEAIEKLQVYKWPGNARELRNFIERGVFQARRRNSSVIEPQDISIGDSAPTRGLTISVATGTLPETVADLSRIHLDHYMTMPEKAYFARALALCKNDTNETARRMGIGRRIIFLKLRQLGLLKKFQKPSIEGTSHAP